jgi:hypothetical protein
MKRVHTSSRRSQQGKLRALRAHVRSSVEHYTFNLELPSPARVLVGPNVSELGNAECKMRGLEGTIRRHQTKSSVLDFV